MMRKIREDGLTGENHKPKLPSAFGGWVLPSPTQENL